MANARILQVFQEDKFVSGHPQESCAPTHSGRTESRSMQCPSRECAVANSDQAPKGYCETIAAGRASWRKRHEPPRFRTERCNELSPDADRRRPLRELFFPPQT